MTELCYTILFKQFSHTVCPQVGRTKGEIEAKIYSLKQTGQAGIYLFFLKGDLKIGLAKSETESSYYLTEESSPSLREELK